MQIKTTLFFLSLLGSGIISAQEIKTYNGPFELNEINGRAEYQYKDAPDGTRIFHGNFRFEGRTDNDGDFRSYRVSGKFKDNHQIGSWTWRGSWDLGFNVKSGLLNQVFSYSFNEKGELDGIATYSRGDNDKYNMNIRNGKIIGPVSFISEDEYGDLLIATWENGHLIGNYVSKVFSEDDDRKLEYLTEGAFNQDGDPIGTWTLKYDNGTVEYIKYSENGDYLESFYFDPPTGDKKQTGTEFFKVEFTPALFRQAKNYLMRDSKEINNNFWDYDPVYEDDED